METDGVYDWMTTLRGLIMFHKGVESASSKRKGTNCYYYQLYTLNIELC